MKLRGPLFASFIGLLIATGAAAQSAPGTAQVTVHQDEFSKTITVLGEKAESHQGVDCTWLIRSFLTKAPNTVSQQLVATIEYVGFAAHYRWAADDAAQPLKVTIIKGPGGLSSDQTEIIGIALDNKTLVARQSTGYRIKLTPKVGQPVILTLTPEMIRVQIAADEKELGLYK